MKELNGMSYEEFTEYIKQYVQSVADQEQYKGEWLAARLGLDNTSNMDKITMGAPIHLAEGPFISTLWGKAVLYDALENHTNSNKIISYINNILLPTREVNIQRMDTPVQHKRYIISANEIQSQHINIKEKTITIPIKAFQGKSLLTLDGPPTPDNPIRYYFILLQSAKDPNIVQPIRIWKGTRTLELKSILTSQALTNEGWEVKIEQGDALIKYMEHNHTLGKDITIPIPRSLYNTATKTTVTQRVPTTSSIDINSITQDPILYKALNPTSSMQDWLDQFKI